MPLIVLQHHPLETPGRLGDELQRLGHRLDVRELFDGDAVPSDLDDVQGVISLGGPQDTDEVQRHAWMQPEIDFLKMAHDAEVPMLGVCLGAQLIAIALGGEVGRMDKPEAGFAKVSSSFFGTVDPLLAGVPWHHHAFHLHGCEVTKAPPGGTPIPLQGSAECKCQLFKVGLGTYGVQYHFEWTRSKLIDVLDENAEWLAKHDVDVAAIKGQFDEHYDLHRHLGDRLCHNFAKLLFPIDKRLLVTGTAKGVQNFHAS
ncbi:MAG: type 1 glutamine amidotransferase [Planctomycetota bacterium]